MSSRKITLLSLIGILLIIYILQLTFDSKGKIKEVKPKTPITKIEIEQTDKNHLLLEKKKESWILNSKHPANTDIADYILASLDDIKIIDTVSKSSNENELEKYGLVNPIVVTGWATDDTQVQKIYVGKTSSTGNQTYIKFADKKEILLVSGNLVIPFNLSENDLLDFTLYSIKTAEVYKIEKYNGDTDSGNLDFRFEKTGEVAEAFWSCENETVDGTKIENWLRGIEILSADKWIEEFDYFNPSTKPDITYILSAAGRDIKVRFYEDNDNSDSIICLCSEEGTFPCYIARSTYEKYLKTISDFM